MKTKVINWGNSLLLRIPRSFAEEVQVAVGETVWLTQAQLVELFDTSKANVSEQIKHIFEEGELQRDSVVRKFRTTAKDFMGLTTFAEAMPKMSEVGVAKNYLTEKVVSSILEHTTQHGLTGTNCSQVEMEIF